MPALEILKGQFTEDEAQEVADAVLNEIADSGRVGSELPIEVRWMIEGAVKIVFGYEEDE